MWQLVGYQSILSAFYHASFLPGLSHVTTENGASVHCLNSWETGSACPSLSNGDVHVWRICLDATDTDQLTRAYERLAPDERARVDRMPVDAPRNRLIMSRWAMRAILARYTGVLPEELHFMTGPQGKPGLDPGNVHFNLSHGDVLALLAVTCAGPVGVDVERIDAGPGIDDVAAQFFTPLEQAQLRSYPNHERVRAFYRGWSRKEAVIKALGEGLSCPLDAFDVTLDESEARLVAFRRDGIDVADWSMTAIEASPDHAAAVAVNGRCQRVVGFDFVPQLASGELEFACVQP